MLTQEQAEQEHDYSFPYHYLNLNIEEYRRLKDIEYLGYLEKVKNELRPFNGQSILDLGCGDGRFCYELKKENVKIKGIDYSKQALNFAEAFNPEINFKLADVGDLSEKEKFDAIVMIEVLEHIKPEEVKKVLQKIKARINKNGKLIITVPSKKMPQPKKHYQHFTEESIQDLLKEYFVIKKITGYGKSGFKRKIFYGLRLLGLMSFPLRKKIKIIDKGVDFVGKYFQEKLAEGSPKECIRLIITCEMK